MTQEAIAENIVRRQLLELAADEGADLRATLAVGEEGLDDLLPTLPQQGFDRVYVIGCGTSNFGAMTAKYLFDNFMGVPTEAMQAHAFATYLNPALLTPRTLVVGFSVGGGAAAVLASLHKAKAQGAYTLAVTAILDSPCAQVADGVVPVGALADMRAPHTKSHLRGLYSLYLTAIRLGERYGASAQLTSERLAHLQRTIPAIGDVVGREAEWQQLAEAYRACTNVHVLGMGPNAGTAKCGSLMMTEMAKILSSGHEMEDFLHGRFREVELTNPMIFLAPSGVGTTRLLDFLTATNQIQASSIVLTDQAHPGVSRLAVQVITMPGGYDEIFSPLVYTVPLFLFGYHLAGLRGWDPSKRRYFHTVGAASIRYADAE